MEMAEQMVDVHAKWNIKKRRGFSTRNANQNKEIALESTLNAIFSVDKDGIWDDKEDGRAKDGHAAEGELWISMGIPRSSVMLLMNLTFIFSYHQQGLFWTFLVW